MCERCEAGTPQAGIPAALLVAAQSIERTRPGDLVPAECWTILAGKSGGAIAWAHYQRMLLCLEAAAARSRRTLFCS